MVNPWGLYTARCNARGITKRETQLNREQQYLNIKLPDSLSYHHAIVDGIEQDVAIINTDNLDTKYIYSMPGEDIRHGSIVEWMENHWLVTERDANTEVYTRAKMLQCNFEIKWIDDMKKIQKRWCIVEDGTKLKRSLTTLWFGVLETVRKKHSPNCWNTLRAVITTA